MLSSLPLGVLCSVLEECGWRRLDDQSESAAACPSPAQSQNFVPARRPRSATFGFGADCSQESCRNGADDGGYAIVLTVVTLVDDSATDREVMEAMTANVDPRKAIVISGQDDAAFWSLASIARLVAHPGFASSLYSQCCFGSSSTCRIRSLSNIAYLDEVSAVCRHVHQQPCHARDQLRTPPHLQHEPPPHIHAAAGTLEAFAIAVPLTWWASEQSQTAPRLRATIAGEECGVRLAEPTVVQPADIVDVLIAGELKSRVYVSAFWQHQQSIPGEVQQQWPQHDIEKAVRKNVPCRMGPGSQIPFPRGHRQLSPLSSLPHMAVRAGRLSLAAAAIICIPRAQS